MQDNDDNYRGIFCLPWKSVWQLD